MVNLYDFFTTGATADLTTHTPDSGTSWVVQVAGGAVQVVSGSNFARENSNASGNRYKMTDDIGTADMTVEGDFTATQAATTFFGVIAQLPSSTGATATEFYWDVATGRWNLVDGVISATLTETWPGGTVHIMLRCEGGILRGYVNGKLKVTLNSTANTGTRAGILLGNFGGGATGASTCDNFHAGPTVPLPGTSTSTSSTSSTSSSISTTSSSTSSTSTSFSSTSVSTSSTSSSISTSSTSSSISSTSSSTSSTSISSTSASTSVSSTSSSMSSTSSSSTSTSSTSSSTSISSTSSSFSSTSSSISSTSRSTSSTSISSTSSSSSTSTTTVPGLDYRYIDDLSLTGNYTFGTTSSAGLSTGGLDQIIGIIYTLPISGVVNKLSVYSPNSGFQIGAIYSDVGGVPTNLIVKNETPQTVVAGQFNDIPITPTFLPAGQYWLTAMTSASSMRAFKAGPGGNKVAYNLSTLYSGGSFPAVFPTPTYSTEDYPIYATLAISSSFTSPKYENTAVDDGDYFIQYGSEYMIQVFSNTWTNNTDTPRFTYKGRTTMDTRVSPVFIQIYNLNSVSWETLAIVNKVLPDQDFQVTVSQATNISNYYDSKNIVAFRVYQKVI